ncbi:MAG TPA: rhomboid family intramembrane serine protease [Rhizomicrobium sp.]|jgi:rhomboid protease GluP|nr:rhomboid family intramembrane serine protease [Rhizomicrobium sp.]
MAFGKRAVQSPPTYLRTAPAAAAPAVAVRVPSFDFTAPESATPDRVKEAPRSIPVVTPLLLVILAVVFVVEVKASPMLGRGFTPPVSVIVAYGAIDRSLLEAGQWWRLFTAPLLHANLGHLLSNAVVFAIIGFMLEPLIGPRWFAGLFAAGALGGSLASILLNEPNLPAVGASGAIMGVLAAAFLFGASARSGPKGRRMQTWALRMMIPALIPLAANSHVDYAGHLGGVIAGLVMGVVLQLVWDRGEDRPHFGNIAAGAGALVLAIGLCAFVFGAGTANVASAMTRSGLIPDAEMPQGETISSDRAAELVARYPHDPRAHLFRGIAFVTGAHDLADAEEQFRLAANPYAAQVAGLSEEFTKGAVALLAITLSYENRQEEAQRLGAPLCDFTRKTNDAYYDTMVHRGICTA